MRIVNGLHVTDFKFLNLTFPFQIRNFGYAAAVGRRFHAVLKNNNAQFTKCFNTYRVQGRRQNLAAGGAKNQKEGPKNRRGPDF